MSEVKLNYIFMRFDKDVCFTKGLSNTSTDKLNSREMKSNLISFLQFVSWKTRKNISRNNQAHNSILETLESPHQPKAPAILNKNAERFLIQIWTVWVGKARTRSLQSFLIFTNLVLYSSPLCWSKNTFMFIWALRIFMKIFLLWLWWKNKIWTSLRWIRLWDFMQNLC